LAKEWVGKLRNRSDELAAIKDSNTIRQMVVSLIQNKLSLHALCFRPNFSWLFLTKGS